MDFLEFAKTRLVGLGVPKDAAQKLAIMFNKIYLEWQNVETEIKFLNTIKQEK